VVASDPLATVIRCVVRGCKPEGISLCGEAAGAHWEYLKTNGHQPAGSSYPPVAGPPAMTSIQPGLQRVGAPARGDSTDEFHPEA